MRRDDQPLALGDASSGALRKSTSGKPGENPPAQDNNVSSGGAKPKRKRKKKPSTLRQSSDKFLIGLVGATLLVTQVVLLKLVLTSWLRVENDVKTKAMARALGEQTPSG
eukprot:TRINITY_DN10413_c0_g1_i1.p2 TRINITY_DN10413_c0_g1~~TRINITY_DN10413_c0_g1_i1.p2  ORF type:complete len:110 (-),score=24.70 TRINITY_DN10413_c0_g1_i1:156-485(-)